MKWFGDQNCVWILHVHWSCSCSRCLSEDSSCSNGPTGGGGLCGVMRIGLVAKGLLIKGDMDLELVLMCREKPTETLLRTVCDNLLPQIEVTAHLLGPHELWRTHQWFMQHWIYSKQTAHSFESCSWVWWFKSTAFCIITAHLSGFCLRWMQKQSYSVWAVFWVMNQFYELVLLMNHTVIDVNQSDECFSEINQMQLLINLISSWIKSEMTVIIFSNETTDYPHSDKLNIFLHNLLPTVLCTKK